MAVSVNDRYIRAVSSVAQTVFTYDFPITTASDIEVLHTDVGTNTTVTLTYPTDYTLTGIGADSGGTFVLAVGAAANDVYTAFGNTPLARATDFTGATSVTTDAINTDYNEEEKQIQQVARDIGRCIKIPLSDNLLTAVTELPLAVERRNMFLQFDNAGDASLSAGTGGIAGAGGANTQIQYNDNGIIEGDSGFTTNGLGSVNISGDLDVDNININGNTISSTNANGNIIMTPNGTGVVDFSGSNQAINMPSGTTAQRPGSPIAGYSRYNTTENVKEYWDGSSWIAQVGGSGDVSGPGLSTDNAVPRFNGTGGTLIQNSGVIIDGSDNITGANSIQLTEVNAIIDVNSDPVLAFNAAGSSVNYMAAGNAPTGSSPGFITMGSDTNAGMFLATKGTGSLSITGSSVAINNGSSGPGELRLLETSSNGTNFVGFKSPTSVTADTMWELPGADGTVNQALITDGSKNLSFRKGLAHAYGAFSGNGSIGFRGTFNLTTITFVATGRYTITVASAVSGASSAVVVGNAQDNTAIGDRQASTWQVSTTVMGINSGQTASSNLFNATWLNIVVFDT